ncbi:hypothetical protein H5410_060430 [Solanum commersonii]|uniref:Uncharacterized protein n=1 Tax=Solanum commersonii TaxID=4109 RepID=A0A9J5W610_SOLCO|nr:hypothetical protein H5410_060430 [Solanum commersonii]
MKTYEKVEKREMILLLENSDIQRREEPWKIFQKYLLNGLYFPGESYKTQKPSIKSSVITLRDINILGSSRLSQQEDISYLQQIEQICFFIEISIPWIHKWVPEVDFAEEQIPYLYRTYYNNFWDKLMKKDPQTKSIYGQELLDQIVATVKEYNKIPNKGIVTDDSTLVKNMARMISNNDEEEQNQMILDYLEEAGEDMHEAQQIEEEEPTDALYYS